MVLMRIIDQDGGDYITNFNLNDERYFFWPVNAGRGWLPKNYKRADLEKLQKQLDEDFLICKTNIKK